VLVSGEQSQRLRFRTLVAHLDTPLEAGGDTQVRYLRYADAEKLAAKLKEQTGAVVAQAGGAPAAQAQATGGVDKSITIWADPDNNALVMTAPPKAMRSLMSWWTGSMCAAPRSSSRPCWSRCRTMPRATSA
jgi:general secretion pathway protein D